MVEEDPNKIKPELAGILYTEVCNNIRATDEISFKLLGLVPLISGAGIFGISIDQEFAFSQFAMVISIFGAVVTIALFIWDLRNIQLCQHYIDCAKKLEGELFDQNEGQFSGRPKPKRKFIRKRYAIRMIYLVTIFAWITIGIISLIA